MKSYPIQNELDFLVARAEAERTEMGVLLNRVRGEGDYWREKAAAKLAAFLDIETQFLSRLTELREDFPELARALEERKSYLGVLASEARTTYEQWQN